MQRTKQSLENNYSSKTLSVLLLSETLQPLKAEYKKKKYYGAEEKKSRMKKKLFAMRIKNETDEFE